jgi:iron complex outermembrane receptor protein
LPYPVPNPSAPGGVTNTIFNLSQGNQDLRPERSTSINFGIEYKPASVPGLKISATYFDIDYKERIENPPVPNGNPFGIFANPATTAALAPFLNLSPTPGEIALLYANPGLQNFLGIPASSIQAIFDDRLANIASSKTQGIDVGLNYPMLSGRDKLSGTLSLTYLISSVATATAGSPPVPQVDEVFSPPHVKARTGVSWARGPLSSVISANFVGGYRNGLNPAAAERVSPWTTFDWHVGYELSAANFGVSLEAVKVTLNVQNLFDTPPPPVRSGPSLSEWIGFDPANASALGRFISVQITMAW